MSETLQRLTSFFRRKERFLILEILSGLVKIAVVRADFEKKRLEVTRVVSVEHGGEEIFPVALIKKALKACGRLERYRIVVSLDPLLATTIHATAVLVRDRPKEPIDDSDLENRIAQGIWRIFDRGRSKAAVKMRVSDLDVLLTDVKVKKIRLDGHRVVNPIGFKAKTVEIQFSETFNPRSFIADLKMLLPEKRIMVIGEAGAVATDIVGKATGEENFFTLSMLNDRTHLFFSDGSAIGHLATYEWGKKDFIGAIAGAFSVSDAVSEEIFRLYILRQASQPVIKRIERLLTEEFLSLLDKLERPMRKYEPAAVYALPFFEAPEFVFGPSLRGELRKKAEFLPVSLDMLNEAFGFEIVSSSGRLERSMFAPLSALLGFYFSPHDDKMNRVARRHARWLIT